MDQDYEEQLLWQDSNMDDMGYEEKIQESLIQVNSEIVSLQAGVSSLKELVGDMQKQHTEINEKLTDMEKGSTDKTVGEEKGKKEKDKPKSIAEICNVFQDIPKLRSVTAEEYELVPSYVKSRVKLEDLNTFISSFNDTLARKYGFSKMKSSREEQKQVFKYRMQQHWLPGKPFCTAEDLRSLGFLRPGVAVRKMVAILAHLGLVREVPAGGGFVAYAALGP